MGLGSDIGFLWLGFSVDGIWVFLGWGSLYNKRITLGKKMVRSKRLTMSHNRMGSFHNRETALARSLVYETTRNETLARSICVY